MKSLKKFLALALALALCFVMALPAMAEGETEPTPAPVGVNEKTTLEIKDNKFNHTYTIYQVFIGDVSTNEDGEKVLSNVKYGSAGYGTADDPVDKTVLEQFTEVGGTYYKNANKFVKDKINNLTAMETGWGGTSKEVTPGYYIIVDENAEENSDEKEADSAYIVEVVGPTSVAPKTTVPELNKTTDSDKSQYQPSIEDVSKTATDKYGHKIGEVFPFDLEAKIPVEHLSKFEKYMIAFNDTMGVGLTFKTGFTVKIGETEINAEDYIVTGSVVKEDGTIGTDVANANFKLQFNNIFTVLEKYNISIPAEGDLIVTVHYTGYLNQNALVWDTDDSGNKNSAHLDFSRDPNNENEYGKTPPDVVTIFTFDIDGLKIEKVNGVEKPLAGAGFTLYDEKDQPIPLYTDEEGNYFVWEVTAENPVPGTLTPVDESPDHKANEIRSNSNGKFVINGLKPGEYVLKETTVPTGYNKAPDMKVVVKITGYTEPTDGGEPTPILEVVKKYVPSDEIANVDSDTQQGSDTDTVVKIENKKGTLLPSTGGIGTTIFYAAGGALVVGAGVLLFIKKRMGSKG